MLQVRCGLDTSLPSLGWSRRGMSGRWCVVDVIMDMKTRSWGRTGRGSCTRGGAVRSMAQRAPGLVLKLDKVHVGVRVTATLLDVVPAVQGGPT